MNRLFGLNISKPIFYFVNCFHCRSYNLFSFCRICFLILTFPTVSLKKYYYYAYLKPINNISLHLPGVPISIPSLFLYPW